MGSAGVAEALRERIRAAQASAGLSTGELSRRAGIPESTLDRKLKYLPDTINVRELIGLASALEVTFEYLGFGIDTEVAA